MIAATFNCALPPEQMSPMDRMGIVFDMVIGASALAMTNLQWIYESPISVGVVLSYGTTTMDIVDLETRIAPDRVNSVSELMTPRSISVAKEEGQDEVQEEPIDNKNCLYWLAIAQLKYCFAENARGLIKGYCLTLIPIAGAEFISAIRKIEPVALFILICFGVLFDRYGEDPRMWWITSAGRDLVKEVSEILMQSPIAEIPDCREGIAWTRH
jgi:hypothetical protein